MTKWQYAVVSVGLIFEAIRQGFLGISDKKGSRRRNVYLRGLFAMNGPLVRHNGERLDEIMDLIQVVASKDFNTPEKIKTLVSAGLGGRSVQVALYPFLLDDLAIDLVVHHGRLLEARKFRNREGEADRLYQANTFVSENLEVSHKVASEYCGFILERMMAFDETIPPHRQGGVIPPRVSV